MKKEIILQPALDYAGRGFSVIPIRSKRDALKRHLSLLTLKEHLEGQMKETFNPSLSRKLDCVAYLLEFGEVRQNG